MQAGPEEVENAYRSLRVELRGEKRINSSDLRDRTNIADRMTNQHPPGYDSEHGFSLHWQVLIWGNLLTYYNQQHVSLMVSAINSAICFLLALWCQLGV